MDDLLFILAYIAPPVALAFVAGLAVPRHPLLAGTGAVALLAAILIAASPHDMATMLPYAGMIALLAIMPALFLAYVGARIRLRFSREK